MARFGSRHCPLNADGRAGKSEVPFPSKLATCRQRLDAVRGAARNRLDCERWVYAIADPQIRDFPAPAISVDRSDIMAKCTVEPPTNLPELSEPSGRGISPSMPSAHDSVTSCGMSTKLHRARNGHQSRPGSDAVITLPSAVCQLALEVHGVRMPLHDPRTTFTASSSRWLSRQRCA